MLFKKLRTGQEFSVPNVPNVEGLTFMKICADDTPINAVVMSGSTHVFCKGVTAIVTDEREVDLIEK